MKKISSGLRKLFSCIPEINNSAIFSTYEPRSHISED
jgi:hypothetical protein